MGCEFIVEEVQAKDLVELRHKYAELCAKACYDWGHSGYTGSMAESPGLEVVTDPVFDNFDAAEDWLSVNTKKWGNTIAVRYGENMWLLGGMYSS